MAKRITELTSATVLAETDLLPVVDISDTTQATSGTTKKSALSLIADYLKARVETLTNKTLTSPKINEDVELTATSTELNKTEDIAGDIVGTTDTQTLTNKTLSTGCTIDENVTLTEVFKKVYPVGSIYTNAGVSTNPATLFGFGTWAAFGAGKVMVGIDSSDADFDTLEETGGNKGNNLQVSTSGYGLQVDSAAFSDRIVVGKSGITQTSEDKGNLQPYIVVYMWKRVA